MRERYQIYEDRNTYLLEVDHTEKTFSIGRVKGKEKSPSYTPIDSSGYKEHIRRIGADYQLITNNLQAK